MGARSDGAYPGDEQFLEAARRGDASAWEEFVQQFRPYLLAVASRRMGSPSNESSSVVQDGIARAFERIGQFRGQTRAELLGWVTRIVANKATDRRTAARPGPIPEGSAGDELLAAGGSTPSSRLSRREQAVRVLNAMDRLPQDYREVVHQRIFQNLDYDEIASNLGRTNDAVRWLWVRALRRLRDELGDDR